MKSVKILGLDPGLARLGFGCIYASETNKTNSIETRKLTSDHSDVHNSLALVEFGVIETSAKWSIEKRLETIYEDLHSIVNELKPDLVSIEKLYFYRMGNVINVAQARGILLLVLGQTQTPYVEFSPPQVKQTLTGYGKADKQEVQAAITQELNLETIPQPDDAADALAIALTAWYHQFNVT